MLVWGWDAAYTDYDKGEPVGKTYRMKVCYPTPGKTREVGLTE